MSTSGAAEAAGAAVALPSAGTSKGDTMVGEKIVPWEGIIKINKTNCGLKACP